MRIRKWLGMTLRELLDRPSLQAEADEEMRFHLAMEAEQKLRDGATFEHAHRDARLSFGGMLRTRESMEDEQPARYLVRLARDLRFALRMLRKTPGFAIAAVLTLAVGIGGNTAVFGAVNGVLLHPLPYPNADRLVTIAHTTKGGGIPKHLPGSSATYDVYLPAKSFVAMALYETYKVTLTGRDLPERLPVAHVTQSIFPVLGVSPQVGRAFTIDEDQPGAASVVILGDALWRRRFAGDRGIIGKSVLLDGRPSVVVGVMPRGFAFPNEDVQLWMPLRVDVRNLEGFHTASIGRLRAGVTTEAAQRELTALLPRVTTVVDFLTPESLKSAGIRPDVHPYSDDVVPGSIRRTLWTLWATVALVLMIACVNVASLLAVRAESRRREISLRSALGAARSDLLAQSITESTVLVVAGTALGVALAYVGIAMLRRFGAEMLPRVAEIHIDGAVLLVTACVAAVAAVVFGFAPLKTHRADRASLLIGLGSREGTADLGALRLRHALVLAQVAMAAMLLVVCGLMFRTARNLTRVDIGFRPDSVLTFRLALPEASYPTAKDVALFHERMLARIRELPGVVAAGATSDLPLGGTDAPGDVLRTDRVAGNPDMLPAVAEMRGATPGYFEAMGIPLHRGRFLRDDDVDPPSGAVLVTDAVARMMMPGREPIGAHVAHGLAGVHDERPMSEVVGVIGDVRGTSLEEASVGAVYYPMITSAGVNMDWLARQMSYAVRVRSEPTALVPSIQALVHELDPGLPITEVRPLRSIVNAASSKTRFAMMGLAAAAAAGLLLGSIGLYGMLAFATSQRTREIGVRIALGARPTSMRALVLRQGLAICAAGLVVGLLGASALRVAIRPLLYQVSATDPFTFVAVSAVLLFVGIIAAWIPANRAARLDPVIALRSD